LTEALNGIADSQLRLDLLKSLIAIDPEAKSSKTALNEALADKVPAVRQLAANQLIATQYRSSIPDLRKVLEHTSLEMRIGAARALGDLGPKAKDAIPDLNKALSRPNADERLIIQDVLFLIDPDSVPLAARELVEILADDTDVVVSLKIQTLLDSVLVNKGFLRDVKKKLKDECPILEQFKFDPLKDVGRITAASGGIDPLKLDNVHFHVLLNGRFGKEKVFDIVKGQMFGRNGFAACMDEGAIVVCDAQATLEQAIDHKKNKSHGKPNAQLMKILARVDSLQTFWLAKAFSKEDAALIRAEANQEIAESSLGLTLHIDYKENATLVFRLFTSDPKTAAYWKEEVLKWRELVIGYLPYLFQDDPKLVGQVKEVLESARIEIKASDLFIQLSIKAEVLEKVAKRFQGE
jgi:hypothetical protein